MLQPLAERMRPTQLSKIIGQQHLIANGKPLNNMLQQQQLSSIIFWGPPGVGKTTIARILAKESNLPFFSLSAINSGVKDVREIIEKATSTGKAVLFLDEIHRFNKAQQDSLLGAVEKGTITLIGATTENPSFEVINALLSRCQVFILKALEYEELETLLQTVIVNDVVLKKLPIEIQENEAIIKYSGGDARKLLNLLELVVHQFAEGEKIIIINQLIQDSLQQKMAMYDKNGEQHYDIISAFIKSIRGSDPNAAVYYLARMIDAGEDVKFIALRLLILAREDIGNANPNALLLANNCFDAVSKIGYPESRIILSQCTIYLACSVKSNAAYMAINNALEIVNITGDLPVPLHLRNAPTSLMKKLDYGKDYQYAHQYENNFIELEFLPDSISGKKLYEPGNNAAENKTREHLKMLWKQKYEY